MFGYAVQDHACGNRLAGVSGSTERSTIPVKCQPFMTPGEAETWSRSGFDPMSARLRRGLTIGSAKVRPADQPTQAAASGPASSGGDQRRARRAAADGEHRWHLLEMPDRLAARSEEH